MYILWIMSLALYLKAAVHILIARLHTLPPTCLILVNQHQAIARLIQNLVFLSVTHQSGACVLIPHDHD